MNFIEPGPEWDVSLLAARYAKELNDEMGKPSPDWLLAILEEGRRRDQAREQAAAAQTG